MISIIALVVISSATIAEDPHTSDGRRGFERLRKLTGEWQMSGQGGRGVTTYTLSADRTTLTQDEAGQLTVFRLDGDDLTLVHYCARGNQPHMRLRTLDDRKVTFAMYHITNLSHPDAYHTTGMELVFLGENRVDLIYRGLSNGRESSQIIHLERRTR
jgi:hypothetical protein